VFGKVRKYRRVPGGKYLLHTRWLHWKTDDDGLACRSSSHTRESELVPYLPIKFISYQRLRLSQNVILRSIFFSIYFFHGHRNERFVVNVALSVVFLFSGTLFTGGRTTHVLTFNNENHQGE